MSKIEGWQSVTIEDCCEILDHKRVPVNSQEREKRIGTIPYYGANGPQGYIDDFIFNEDLILIAEDGGNFSEFATRPIAYRISGKSWVNNHAHVLRAKVGFVQPLIFYLLEHKDIQPFIVGGTRAKLNQGELRSITLYLPKCKKEQAQIAAILGTIDKAIEQTEAIIAKQQRIKAGLMQDLLTRGIDEHGNIRTEETHEFKDSPLGRIPAVWEVVSLQDISIKITDGDHHTPQRSKEGIFLLSARNILNGRISLSNVDYVPVSEYKRMIKRCHPQSGDILISCSGTIGRVCEVPTWLKCVLVRSVALIKLQKIEIHSRFVAWVLRSEQLQTQILSMQRKAAQPNLFQSEIAKLQCVKPSLDEQVKISTCLDTLDQDSDKEKAKLAKLRVLKTGLMQDLLTGKVRVTHLGDQQDPNA